jgi:hypothetical protein
MTHAETTEFLHLWLPRFYGQRAPVRPRERAAWQAALAPYTEAVVLLALQSWAHWHSGTPPTAMELAGRCRYEQSSDSWIVGKWLAGKDPALRSESLRTTNH